MVISRGIFWHEIQLYIVPIVTNISSERASQEEQNGTNFSFIAPFNEELCARKEI